MNSKKGSMFVFSRNGMHLNLYRDQFDTGSCQQGNLPPHRSPDNVRWLNQTQGLFDFVHEMNFRFEAG